MNDLLGRESELLAVRQFLKAVLGGPAACVLVGEAGIGKSSLWREGVGLARGQGVVVLECRPSEAEAPFSFAGVSDLLEPVLEQTMPELPMPQRSALEVALLRSTAVAEQDPDPRVIGVALLGTVRLLSMTGPVLCAIDDSQWLDRASAGALEFAARRLRSEGVGFLVCLRRSVGEGPMPLGLDRALPSDKLTHVALTSLGLNAIEGLLRSRLGMVLSRATVRRLFEVSSGNPFYALELGRALERRGAEPEPGEPLPLPSGLQGLLAERLAALPHDAREVLLLASALTQPTLPVVEEALGAGQARSGLRAALRAKVVELDGDRIRFTHPLLASASFADALPSDRRWVHARLSEVAIDIEERARHLALAAERPEASTATTLAQAAWTAAGRGAPGVAAELATFAVSLTPEELVGLRQQRALEAAEFLLKAGDTARARRELERLVEVMPAGEGRGEALMALAWVRLLEAGNRACVAVLEQALAEAGSNRTLIARIHVEVAKSSDFDLRQAQRHLDAGLALLEDVDVPGLLGPALTQQMVNLYLRGFGLDRQLAERAVALDQELQTPWVQRGAVMNFAVALKQTDQLDEARGWFGRALVQARDRGDESTLPDLLAHLADLECWAGNWSLADRYATESEQAFEFTGQLGWMGIPSYARALVDAHLGRIDTARSAVEQGLAVATAVDDIWAEMMLCAAAGFVELSVQDLELADSFLGRAHLLAERIGLGEPSVWRFHANEIEVAISLGDLERAARLLVGFLRQRGGPQTTWTVATAARCQGLLEMAQGDGAAAEAQLDRALALHEGLPMPFERARTLLIAGQIHRRNKHKRAAKAHLQRALEIFSSLPAPVWERRARDDLSRIGLRPPGPVDLSATEHAAARLAAIGRTNREIAEELYISPKTVEANLARAYRKLGITSRVQLGAALVERGSLDNS